jgi:hypothetical protein
MSEEQTEFGNEDPVWIDRTWLDTVVVVGLTCFILCLMGLSKVRQKKSVVICNCESCSVVVVAVAYL